MTTGTQWITDRPPADADLDIEGMIQIPVRPGSLSTTRGTSVSLDCWSEGIPWRHTKRRRQRQQQSKQLEIAATSTCKTCRYWSGQGEDFEGFCRRHAPHPHPVIPPGKELIIIWPSTWDEHWCGEWEARQ